MMPARDKEVRRGLTRTRNEFGAVGYRPVRRTDAPNFRHWTVGEARMKALPVACSGRAGHGHFFAPQAGV